MHPGCMRLLLGCFCTCHAFDYTENLFEYFNVFLLISHSWLAIYIFSGRKLRFCYLREMLECRLGSRSGKLLFYASAKTPTPWRRWLFGPSLEMLDFSRNNVKKTCTSQNTFFPLENLWKVPVNRQSCKNELVSLRILLWCAVLGRLVCLFKGLCSPIELSSWNP